MNTVALVRSELPEGLITATSRRIAAALDRTVPLEMDVPLSDEIESYLSERRMLMKVLGVLALIGCTLAGFGLYAAIAFTAGQRTREFGVRLALGAQGRDILLLVLREGVHLAGVGIAIGLGGAAVATRVLQSRLYGVTPLDPATYAAAVLILGLVALLATLMPARAATRIEPVSATKYE
jgi:ABC-type antimicrobial peptide transport system permease subunit